MLARLPHERRARCREVHATNLERNLYLALQVIETGLPVVVVALNMADLVENGDKIDTDKLSKNSVPPS